MKSKITVHLIDGSELSYEDPYDWDSDDDVLTIYFDEEDENRIDFPYQNILWIKHDSFKNEQL